MARSNDPNSAGTQFFICLDTHKHLDRNYTAFGKTADEESLKTVRAIGKIKTGAGDKPTEKVIIRTATVKESPKA
jgi:cyclophilin family peptidyl-prolyl cis-trans isomerase